MAEDLKPHKLPNYPLSSHQHPTDRHPRFYCHSGSIPLIESQLLAISQQARNVRPYSLILRLPLSASFKSSYIAIRLLIASSFSTCRLDECIRLMSMAFSRAFHLSLS